MALKRGNKLAETESRNNIIEVEKEKIVIQEQNLYQKAEIAAQQKIISELGEERDRLKEALEKMTYSLEGRELEVGYLKKVIADKEKETDLLLIKISEEFHKSTNSAQEMKML